MADSARAASKLGVQVGDQNWLIDLADAGEVMPVPPITPVPLTRAWFRGWPTCAASSTAWSISPSSSAAASRGGEQARLVLLGERFRTAAALLVDRSLGLRNPAQLRARAGIGGRRLAARRVRGRGRRRWSELDVGALVRDAAFLAVGN